MRGLFSFIAGFFAPAETPDMRFVAFGDWGRNSPAGRAMARTINGFITVHNPTAVWLLGDNFYPAGIDPRLGVNDPMFSLFTHGIAADLANTPFCAVLGNHDVEDQNGQFQVEFSKSQQNWIMPENSHFKKFNNTVCVWFIDTSGLRGIPADTERWLVDSLETESKNCVWKIFATHVPFISQGVYHNDITLALIRAALGKYITRFGIHMFVSGHDHSSQVLRHSAFPNCVFVVAGKTYDSYQYDRWAEENKERLVWGNNRNSPVVMQLEVFRDRMEYAFVSLGRWRQTELYRDVIRIR
jgi:hypothetical protein